MATIEITITAGAQTYTNTKNVSTAHLLRLLAAQKARLNLPSGASQPEVADALIADTYDTWRQQTLVEERNTATETSLDAVTPIDWTDV